MADFPSAIFTPRTVANVPGVTYDAADTKTGYAEDYSLPAAEIEAIETVLGTDPQGGSDTVGERIGVLEAAKKYLQYGFYIAGQSVGTVRIYRPLSGAYAGNTFAAPVGQVAMRTGTINEATFWTQQDPAGATWTIRINNQTKGTSASFTTTAPGVAAATTLGLAVDAGDVLNWDLIASSGSVFSNFSLITLLEF